MDASAFCMATAVYDTLFSTSADGKTWLPNLALSATPNKTYTSWTIKLRSGVTFHNGDAFDADNVVANYNAQKANLTVGLAIQPLIAGVTKVDSTTVVYNTKMPWTVFPFQLSEQQIAFMAHSSCLDSAGGKPIGTGPFMLNNLSDWDHTDQGNGDTMLLHKNPNYWKKDSAGNSLPYVDTLTFKVIVDNGERLAALRSGTIDLMWTNDGGTIASLKSTSGITYRTDMLDAREPAVNCLIMNTQMGANSVKGAVNPNTLGWDSTATSVVADVTIRQACAMAIDRAKYLSIVDGGIGQTLDGLYRAKVGTKANPLYKDPKYPKYSVTNAKKLVDAWKKKNGNKTPSFVIDIVDGSTAQLQAFTFIKNALAAVGISVISRPLTQVDLIGSKINKHYDASSWSQFGGVTPDLNYVWFNSSPFLGVQSPNYVNFAQQADKKINDAMLAGMAATSSAARIKAWQTVNSLMATDLPYLFLDSTVTAFAAKTYVSNYAYAAGPAAGSTATGGSTRIFSPDGGSAHWEYIYVK
jgi:ABC-type transport system substrate-binding protein